MKPILAVALLCSCMSDPESEPAALEIGARGAPLATGAMASVRAQLDDDRIGVLELEPGAPAIVAVSPIADATDRVLTSQLRAIAAGTTRLRIRDEHGDVLASGAIEVADPRSAVLVGRVLTPSGIYGQQLYAGVVAHGEHSVVALEVLYRDAMGRTLDGAELARIEPPAAATITSGDDTDQLILTSSAGAQSLVLHAGAEPLLTIQEVVVTAADVAAVSIDRLDEATLRPGQINCLVSRTRSTSDLEVLGAAWTWQYGNASVVGDSLCYTYRPNAPVTVVLLHSAVGIRVENLHGDDLGVFVPGEPHQPTGALVLPMRLGDLAKHVAVR